MNSSPGADDILYGSLPAMTKAAFQQELVAHVIGARFTDSIGSSGNTRRKLVIDLQVLDGSYPVRRLLAEIPLAAEEDDADEMLKQLSQLLWPTIKATARIDVAAVYQDLFSPSVGRLRVMATLDQAAMDASEELVGKVTAFLGRDRTSS